MFVFSVFNSKRYLVIPRYFSHLFIITLTDNFLVLVLETIELGGMAFSKKGTKVNDNIYKAILL